MKDTDCLSTKHRMPPPPSCFNKEPEASLSMGHLLTDSAPSLKSWHMVFSQPSTDPACSGHQCLSPRHSALPWQQPREGGACLALSVDGLRWIGYRPSARGSPPCLSLGSEKQSWRQTPTGLSLGGGEIQRKRVQNMGKSSPKAGVFSHSPPYHPPPLHAHGTKQTPG